MHTTNPQCFCCVSYPMSSYPGPVQSEFYPQGSRVLQTPHRKGYPNPYLHWILFKSISLKPYCIEIITPSAKALAIFIRITLSNVIELGPILAYLASLVTV